ncbi:HAMP domain-containing histidine kinase [Aerococcaceae bacterium DSM 111176]|nr:HAMP domain-containing histidine kinase [Aerococcaceae bacterium DSM 111176]
MKIVWQQILGMLLVLVTALMIIALRIEQSVTQEITENRQAQLINYGQNIVENNFSREDLVRTSQLLASENIIIQVYLPNGRTIYPTYDQTFNAKLSQEDLIRLNQDEIIGFRIDNRMKSDGVEEPYLTVYLPHHDIGEFPDGFISLGAPLDALESRLSAVRNSIYTSFVIAVIAGIILAALYAFLQTRKIKRLQLATREVAQGNYDVTVDLDSKDELGDLARDFEMMTHSLRDSQEEIRRQEDLRRQFMMDAAHEMRTPLTTMKGLIEGLQNDMIPENYRDRSLELIAKETDRLTRLVNENLDYEKIRTNQYSLTKREIDGNKLFAGIQQQMMVKAREKEIWITVDAPDDFIIWADYDRLRQILINLINNAIQFAYDSEVVIKGCYTKNGVQIDIIDHGIGIAAEDVKKIWERFYKADISRKNTKYGESGIGLAVVHSLVEAHGGNISVQSTEGEGSTFIVLLPSKERDEVNE